MIPNNRLLALVGQSTSMVEAFRKADSVLLNAVQGISDLMTVPGLINVDFADVRTIMSGMGRALMGTGIGTGKRRATEAAETAISSPLLEDVSIDGAQQKLAWSTVSVGMSSPRVAAGAFSVVLECVPEELAQRVTASLSRARRWLSRAMFAVRVAGSTSPMRAASWSSSASVNATLSAWVARRAVTKNDRTSTPAGGCSTNVDMSAVLPAQGPACHQTYGSSPAQNAASSASSSSRACRPPDGAMSRICSR